jgi:hypothetical protein
MGELLTEGECGGSGFFGSPQLFRMKKFLKVIEKARESCKNANNPILDHFVDANKSIPVPKGGVQTDSLRDISSITVSSGM